ncbi:hypothetical protein [Embleya hyalina]|nr:hypothetical protein [Embleya hyalina]
MPSTSPPFELRLRWTRNNTKMIAMAIGVCALMFVPDIPLGLAIAGWVFFGLGGLLAAAMPRIAPVALRMDAEGVAVSRGIWRSRRVAWADVEAVVSWRVRDGSHWVGIVATPEYRRRTGLDTRRGGRWMDNIIGLPIAWTTTKWDGPPDELKTMVAAVWHISPDTPWIDAALHDRTAPA